MKPLTFIRGAWLVCACTLLSTLMLACAGPAGARTSTTADGFESTPFKPSSTSTSSSSGDGGSIIRTIVGLAIVIAVIYGLTWVIRQTKAAKNPATGYGLEQLATLPLATNRSVALVRVGAELHLLGISEHGVTGIRVYSEEEAYELGLPLEVPDDALSASNSGLPPVQRLGHALRRFTTR
jgi:flagellar protein FliO/FliZ